MRLLTRLPAQLCLVAALGACRTAPTTVLVEIRAGAGLPALQWVELDVYGEQGVAVQARRLPAQGNLEGLPSTVVLYPPQSEGELRLRGLGLVAGVVEGEGAVRVTLRAHAQTSAILTLEKGRLPDKDGDSVPDLVDSCPELPNPDQKPCPKTDGPPPSDMDVDPDLAVGEARPDLICDQDKDGFLSAICGGNDCDDSNAAVHPAPREGSAGQPSCSDGLDNDCDGAKDGADPDCITCTSDPQCDDGTICTSDTCSQSVCVHTPANEGKVCDDNKCATGTKCEAGRCSGKPRVCPAPADTCKQASCDPAVGCIETSRPDGSTCADADPCTTGETCLGGVCTAPQQAAQCYVDGACRPAGTKPDSCRICDPTKSKTAWTILPGYCFISGQCRPAGPLSGTCLVCDPANSTTSWTAPAGCGITLVALNEAHTGALGGLSGANGLCQAQAQAAGLSGTFKAFLSTSTQAAKNLISGAAVATPVVNSKGQLLWSSWTAMFGGTGWPTGTSIYSFDGKLVDEGTGANPDWSDADAWTGTMPDGSAAADTCLDWTSTIGNGVSGEIDLNHLLNLTEYKPCTTYQAVVCVKVVP